MGSLEGEVFSGMEIAKEFLEMEAYKQRISSLTDFEPFPGTLNLEVDKEKFKELKEEVEGVRIDGFEVNGEEFGGMNIFSVSIGEVEAAVLEIDRSDYGDEVAEVIAPVKLREEMGLEVGDKVELEW